MYVATMGHRTHRQVKSIKPSARHYYHLTLSDRQVDFVNTVALTAKSGAEKYLINFPILDSIHWIHMIIPRKWKQIWNCQNIFSTSGKSMEFDQNHQQSRISQEKRV